MVEFGDEVDEFVLICAFVLVKLDNPLLEDVEEGVDAVVVGLFLEASCKSRINGHHLNYYRYR